VQRLKFGTFAELGD